MDEMYRMGERIKEELDKIAEKGLNIGNLDHAYKLIDMYKDLKNVDYWEAKKDYYETDGYSERNRKRDSHGRYSRSDGYSYRDGSDAYDRYIDSKRTYRHNAGDGNCKQRLMNTLDDYMDSFTSRMEEMLRDADCAEERETIQRYLSKLNSLS